MSGAVLSRVGHLYNEEALDIEKLLKVVLFHDTIEIITGDEFPSEKQEDHYAIKNLHLFRAAKKRI